jgi:uncharacterized protein YndB with AHSA1/START domain
MNTTTQPVSLKVSRLIKAPRERVFAAWITPSDIMKWFGPEGCHALSARIDACVGGEYHFHMKTETMGEIDLRGVYREVKSPSRLVFTWYGVNCNPEMEGAETVVTVDFLDRGESTEVQISHDLFPNAEARDQHEYGWNGCLDRLEKLV